MFAAIGLVWTGLMFLSDSGSARHVGAHLQGHFQGIFVFVISATISANFIGHFPPGEREYEIQ
jgi:hypothetical protein